MKNYWPTQQPVRQGKNNRTPILRQTHALFICFSLCLFGAVSATAQRIEPAPKDIQDVTVVEKLENQIPLTATFKNENGETVQFANYLNQDKPVILAFNFFQCPLLCHLILDGLVESMQNLNLEPGSDFELVSLSFNPLDTPTLAKTWKQKYVKQYGKPSTASGWHFLTGIKSDIQQVTDAAGYYYQWVEERQEYAHIAAIVLLTPDGKVSRYMYGIDFDPKTLRLSLVEASQGEIGSTLDRIILTCYYYDETAGRYAPLAFNIMRIGGGLTILLLGSVLLTFWIRESKKSNPKAEGAQTLNS